ncbi:probable histidine kinase 5 [Zingiber officinale]|uniref:probable histidine kinase 5 n=1 Tax=Zingiber officinale TaxID=94328 RepID=UPI001C4D7163|nr:probable histidine kinase 5 [Zingiber officinale]
MAKKRVAFAGDRYSKSFVRSRNVLMVLSVLCCVSCSMWLLWKPGNSGILEKFRDLRNPIKKMLFDRFNSRSDQLRALALLISSLDQGRFFECMNKSVSDAKLGSKLLQTLIALNSEMDHTQGQQDLIGRNIFFGGRCSIQIGCINSTESSLSCITPQKIMPSTTIGATSQKDSKTMPYERELAKSSLDQVRVFSRTLYGIRSQPIVAIGFFSGGFAFGVFTKSLNKQFQLQKHYRSRRWSKNFLILGILLGLSISLWIFVNMNATITERMKETLVSMCDERARMLQDQFNVSMNHVHALAILVSTFHHGKQPSAIDQQTFAEYTGRTAFERPLMSGVAYALRVLHAEREEFEKKHGWRIKKMETEDQSLVKDDYNPEELDPSPVQDEYAPVILSQETVSHIVSIDMMSGKQDRENILRARASGKGVLTSPFNLLKSNHLGVVLTFAVYNTSLPPNATPEERISATVGYLGSSFDIPSLVDKLLHQLASKQTIVVNLYDTTNVSAPIRMYGPDAAGVGETYISNVDFGDPTRKHEMHCRFKHKRPLPWSAIAMSVGVAVIVLLVGHIFHATLNRIEEVEYDYRQMRELKVQAEAADVAKSQFLATVSHEIRTPMNGVLGMLQMLMDTELDPTQKDFAMTAQSSGKALIAIINEVLDLAKIESGRLELEAVPFDPRDVLDNILSLFSDKSQAKGIEMAVYVSEQVPEILIGDPGRFRQIITNLVGNSVKFTEVGHIFVSVYLIEEIKNKEGDLCETLSGFQVVDKQEIWENFTLLKSSTGGNNGINLIVSVEDTGVGIPQNVQCRIFTPFMQADSSTSRMYGGTGIGLSISRCLVNLMGGEIGFVSMPGIGSTFAFTAVFREGCKSSGNIKRHYFDSTLSNVQGMRGLVVDGRPIRARVIEYHLQRLGIHVDIVTKQDMAVQTILDSCCTSGRNHIDMVLVDKDAWGEGSGKSFPRLFSECQQHGTLMPQEHQPKMFLIATSLTSTEVSDLKSAGYDDSILKPLRLSMIIACLHKALGTELKQQHTKRKPVALQSILRGKNILVVDDNLVNQRVAAGTLKKFGARVTCVDSGKEAIRRLQPPHNFDACFMDVQMPEMDGFEATQKIRDMENRVNELIKSGDASSEIYGSVSHRPVPILAMTADVIQATHEHCLRSGMDDYVSKPFEEQQLYSAVAHFFESETKDGVA